MHHIISAIHISTQAIATWENSGGMIFQIDNTNWCFSGGMIRHCSKQSPSDIINENHRIAEMQIWWLSFKYLTMKENQFIIWRPGRGSNPHRWNRNPLFYPLYYRDTLWLKYYTIGTLYYKPHNLHHYYVVPCRG